MRTCHVLQIVSLSLAAMLTPVLVSAQQSGTASSNSSSTPTTDKDTSGTKAAKPADKPSDKSGTAATDKTTQDGRKLEKLEDPEPPAVKLGKSPSETKVTEIHDESGVKETKVETGLSTYYVRPNTQIGTAQPGDTQSTFNRGAEWKIMEFNLGEKKKKTEDEQAGTDDGAKK